MASPLLSSCGDGGHGTEVREDSATTSPELEFSVPRSGAGRRKQRHGSQEAARAEDISTWKSTLTGPPLELPPPMFPGSPEGRGHASLSSAPGTHVGFCESRDWVLAPPPARARSVA